jgi:hypothetical protein
VGPFSVRRWDWLHKKWFTLAGMNPDPFATPSQQEVVALGARDVFPSDLESFTSERALRIAVTKLTADGYSLRQQVAIARAHFRIAHPGADQLVRTADSLLDERLASKVLP